MSINKDALTVIDFFGGAGGFSEGFRQQGFKIIKGIDNWRPAVETFNHNFGLDGKPMNVLEFAGDVDLINQLPDSDVILGSPPCVSFSSSNKQGGADKTLGISLIETFFRIVAVKKHQPNSKLKAWFMENVSNSIKHTKSTYTFAELSLTEWANSHNLDPDALAINFIDNHKVLSSFDFGVAQARKRLFAGEVVSAGGFPTLENKTGKTVREIFRDFPKPFELNKVAVDSNYPDIQLGEAELTDHHYDTGIYKDHWEYSKYCKVNHPYMGRMSFPENLDKPSRTITASKLDNSREAIIYHDQLNREGDGQYRTPTIREIAILMSFPITYQFLGSETTKWRLVGNAVTPLVSAAIARATLKTLRLPLAKKPFVELDPKLNGVLDLANSKLKVFDRVLVRRPGARFRRHPFKEGNMTVALSNYCLARNGDSDGVWRATVTYGTGKNFRLQEVNNSNQQEIENYIIENFEDGVDFIGSIKKYLLCNISNSVTLQNIYEKNQYGGGTLHPVEIIEQVQTLVSNYANGEVVDANSLFWYKDKIHKRQLYALYAIDQSIRVINNETNT